MILGPFGVHGNGPWQLLCAHLSKDCDLSCETLSATARRLAIVKQTAAPRGIHKRGFLKDVAIPRWNPFVLWIHAKGHLISEGLDNCLSEVP